MQIHGFERASEKSTKETQCMKWVEFFFIKLLFPSVCVFISTCPSPSCDAWIFCFVRFFGQNKTKQQQSKGCFFCIDWKRCNSNGVCAFVCVCLTIRKIYQSVIKQNCDAHRVLLASAFTIFCMQTIRIPHDSHISTNIIINFVLLWHCCRVAHLWAKMANSIFIVITDVAHKWVWWLVFQRAVFDWLASKKQQKKWKKRQQREIVRHLLCKPQSACKWITFRQRSFILH